MSRPFELMTMADKIRHALKGGPMTLRQIYKRLGLLPQSVSGKLQALQRMKPPQVFDDGRTRNRLYALKPFLSPAETLDDEAADCDRERRVTAELRNVAGPCISRSYKYW